MIFKKKEKYDKDELIRFVDYVVNNIGIPSEVYVIEQCGNDILKELKRGKSND